jgi:hypothetical protein
MLIGLSFLAAAIALPGDWKVIDNTDNTTGERTVIAYLNSLDPDDEMPDPRYVKSSIDLFCVGGRVEVSLSWMGSAPKEKGILEVIRNGDDPDTADNYIVEVSRYGGVDDPSLKFSAEDANTFRSGHVLDRVTVLNLHSDTNFTTSAFVLKGFNEAVQRVESQCASK